MNVVVPMAGSGKRFRDKGYVKSKPFIDVNGIPMIVNVLQNSKINFDEHRLILICRSIDLIDNSFGDLLRLHGIFNYIIISVDYKTEGAAQTILKAKEFINNDDDLLIFNSDQLIEYKRDLSFDHMRQFDGGILCFHGEGNEWSYAKVDNDGLVVEVREKSKISNIATAGYYYWNRGCDFVKYCEQMIENNDRVNNEFYVAPVYNYAIRDGKRITTFMVDKIYQLGTPEWLERYLNE